MSQLNKIIDAIGHFCKLAGLLQVPEKALGEMNEWLEACYCYEVAVELKKKIDANNKREKKFATFDDKFEVLSSSYELLKMREAIYNLQHTSDRDNHVVIIDKLIDIGTINLPKFHRYKIDPSTDMEGVIEEYGDCLSFIVYPDDKNVGQYYYGLDIDYDDKDSEGNDNKIKVSEDHESISLEKLVKLLIKDYENIDNLVTKLDYFKSGYETYEDEYLKQIQMTHGYCINKAKDITIEDMRLKKIEINGIDLGYTKNSKKSVKLGIKYIMGPEQVAHLPVDNNYLGFWQESKFPEHGFAPHYIGSINIISPILRGKEFPFEIGKLKKDIQDIQSTAYHEMQHFVQTFIKYINKANGGFPSKKIMQKGVDYNGKPTGGPTSVTVPMKEKDEYGRIIHPLRDVEFYTRLSDSVYYFNEAKIYFPLQLHRDLMLNYIDRISDDEFKKRIMEFFKIEQRENGYDTEDEYFIDRARNQFNTIMYSVRQTAIYAGKEFFEALKKHQPLKYGKAVAVFTNAVGL